MAYKSKQLPIGDKFNKLTILEEVFDGAVAARRYVYCLCDCGSKKVLRYDLVRSGDTKSCGCLLSVKSADQIEKMVITRRRNRENVIVTNYIGKRFNKLIVDCVYQHPKSKGTWFTLTCDCGKVKHVSLRDLKRKHVQSCGCDKHKYAITFVSQIDGEEMLVSKGKKGQYLRILAGMPNDSREHLHVHEAKKAYRMAGIEWQQEYVVHHIDSNKLNNHSNNLSVMEDTSAHFFHHAKIERATYEFLTAHGLLEDFYRQYPELKLTTLLDLV